MTIVPIMAHKHWDDIQQVWRLKISRQEKDNGGTKAWVPLVEFAGTWADITTQEALYWVIQPPSTPDPDQVAAPMGDLAELTAFLTAATPRIVVGSPVLAAPEEYAPVDPDLTVYDGTGDSWGVTPP